MIIHFVRDVAVDAEPILPIRIRIRSFFYSIVRSFDRFFLLFIIYFVLFSLAFVFLFCIFAREHLLFSFPRNRLEALPFFPSVDAILASVRPLSPGPPQLHVLNE